MSYIQFQIGDKFPLPIHAQGDGGLFQYDCNGMMFILRLSRIDLIATEAFRTGKLEIGLFEKQGILFFLYKIDGIFNGWGDCPFHISSLTSNQWPSFKEEPDLHLFLIEANLNLLLAARRVKVSNAFQRILQQTTQKQMQSPFSKTDYLHKVQEIWNSCTSQKMASNACCREEFAFSLTGTQAKKQ